jgi:hypothetical protein
VATFVVSTVDGAGELVGVVREVESGRIQHFDGPDGLVTALSGGRSPDPGPGELNDGLGSETGPWVDHPSRDRAITPAQLRITYLSVDRGAAREDVA